ncbi:hypothetical protein H4Q32_014114 [Labeo rohita]|uniref:Reverse transcriptase domain-containing protein n=1 Tax=Labeo rohita TaxID=84645 RepID=A0ABQ8LTQ8_LABRO|nr:hypothetical protein H4Q32_014114 [Labeo rohita]
MDQILQVTPRGDADWRLQTMCLIIITIAAERFGVKEQHQFGGTAGPNRWEEKIRQLRQELRLLRKQFKQASEENRAALAELRNIVRSKLTTTRRAECHKKRSKERARRYEIDKYLSTSYSDTARDQDLGPCSTLISPPEPSVAFNLKDPTLREVQKRLWKIIKVIWRRGKVVQQWRHAEGVWIPKEENSSNIEQFRVIPLLSVEGKIFFSIVARRMTEFLLQNEYIDIAVQKGGIPKVPGCIEHTGVITQLIQEALEGGGDLAVLWLDLANAYESIPHKVVETSLTRHHVPEKISNLILNYYSCFKLRVTSGTVTSAFHRLEKGIITGCILFALAMNMIVKSAEVECRGPLSRSGLGPNKPAKSQSLVLRRGNVTDKFHFSLGRVQISSITEKPVKSLGKVFNSTLKDTVTLEETGKELHTWIAAVDKSGLPGKFKAWIYQHGILPRLLWPLLVYDVPLTTVESFERKISHSLRRWLGLPRSFTSIAL